MPERLSPFETNRLFLADRPIMSAHDTVERLGELLLGEVSEWQENPTDPDELADIIIFASYLLEALGHDPEEAFRNKIGVNAARHPASDYQEGDFSETYKRNKQLAKEMGFE